MYRNPKTFKTYSNGMAIMALIVILFAGNLIALPICPDEETHRGDSISAPLYVFAAESRFEIPTELSESSGLIFFAGGLWSHNDSQGEPEIYKMDTASGKIIQTIRIRDGKNNDWEDIEQDEAYIYVGDFGNNLGNRKDLSIYRISKGDIPTSGDKTVDAGRILFSYEDQESFVAKNRANNYDCESMIVHDGHIYLFSKNWENLRTRAYKLNSEPGDQVARLAGEFNFGGLATAASLNETGTRLMMIGYKDYCPLMWIFKGFSGDSPFSGKRVKVELPYNCGDQTEGLCFVDSVKVYMSSELSQTSPRVFHFDTRMWDADPDYGDVYPVLSDSWNYTILHKKKKFTKELNIDLSIFRALNIRVQLQDEKDRDITPASYHFDKHMGKTYIVFDIKRLPPGPYTIRISSGHSVTRKDIIIN